MAHELAELGSGDAVGDDLVGHAEAAHVFLRDIDSALEVVDADVLPEVGELQAGAGCVGKFEILFSRLGGHFSAGVEHQAADGIGRVAAVVDHAVHGFVARNTLVLAKSDEQIGERLLGNGAGADGFRKRDEDWMARAALVAGVEFPAPQVEKRESLGFVGDLIAEIVGDAAIRVDGIEVRLQIRGQEPCGDVEVFVVRLGQVATVLAGLIERGRSCGNSIARRERIPAAGDKFIRRWLGCSGVQWSSGLISIISLTRRGRSSQVRLRIRVDTHVNIRQKWPNGQEEGAPRRTVGRYDEAPSFRATREKFFASETTTTSKSPHSSTSKIWDGSGI